MEYTDPLIQIGRRYVGQRIPSIRLYEFRGSILCGEPSAKHTGAVEIGFANGAGKASASQPHGIQC